jgi:hypothetical protein
MKITCECLVTRNKDTGLLEPLVLDFPDGRIDELNAIRRAGWEAGRRFKLGLDSMKEDADDGSTTEGTLRAMKDWMDVDAEASGISAKDPLAALGAKLAELIVKRDYKDTVFYQEFMGEWDNEETRAEAERIALLERVGANEFSDDEVFEMIQDGKL